MNLRTRKTSWIISGLFLFAVVSAGLEVVVAQPKSETRGPDSSTGEAIFELFGENKFINLNNVAYTSDEGRWFDIFFSCSSTRGEDPLRLIDAKDIKNARSYFNNEKQYGKHFLKFNKYCIHLKHISYVESMGDSLIVRFNARIADAFVNLTLAGADAESFRKKMREF